MRSLVALASLALLASACSDRGAPAGDAAPSASASGAPTASASASALGSSSAPAPHASASAPPERDAEVVPDQGARLALAWHPKGRAVLVARGKTLMEIAVPEGKKTSVELPLPIEAIAYAFDGSRLAVGDQGPSLRVLASGDLSTIAEWLAPPPASTAKPDEYPPEVHAITFSPDGKLVAMSTQRLTDASPRVAIYDVAAKKRRCESEQLAFDLAFTASGAALVTTGVGAMARLDATSCEEKASGSAATGGTFGSWVAPLGGHLAAADAAGHELSLFESGSFQRIGVLAKSAGCTDHIGPVRFSRDGKVLLATGSGRWVRTFRVESMRSIAAYDVPSPDDAWTLPFDDGERLLVVRGEKAELVSLVSKTVAYTLETKGASLFSHSWDMKRLAGLSETTLFVWDTATGKLEVTIPLGS